MTPQEAERRCRQSERDRKAEQDRRDQHIHDEARRLDLVSDDHRVLNFKQWCELNGFSLSTGRRIINASTGPVITQLSPRRIGVTIGNNRAWQESRARSI